MKREKEILQAFSNLGYAPRDNQVSIVSDVVSAFIDEVKRNVVLVAGVGVGKSLIAAAVSETLLICSKTRQTTEYTVPPSAIYCTSTNMLLEQYADSFKKLPEEKFFRIKGAVNYPCNYFRNPKTQNFNDKATGEDCVIAELSPFEKEKYCETCEYKKAQKLAQTTDNLVTNYAYWITSKLHCGSMKYRPLQVMDESHLLNDTFCSLMTVEISVDLLDRLIKDVTNNTNGKCEDEIARLILAKNDLSSYNQNNYKEKILGVAKIYATIVKKCEALVVLIPDLKARTKMRKVASRFSRLIGLIKQLIVKNYEHVLDTTVKDVVLVKPVFINGMMDDLLAERNLFMSATLSPNYVTTTMGLTPTETKFIVAPEVFPAENKPLHFVGKTALNYEKMKNTQTFIDLGEIISMIIEHHSAEKGIIIVPSFYATKMIVQQIPSSVKIFQHLQGSPVSETVSAFKAYKKPSVMISPSIFEGIDLPGLTSEFQIILKCPFPSLGDPRISKIARDYPDIYKEMTLYKILQAIGRSIRSKEDRATTYMMDSAIQNLFNSKFNLWKDRFLVIK